MVIFKSYVKLPESIPFITLGIFKHREYPQKTRHISHIPVLAHNIPQLLSIGHIFSYPHNYTHD